MLGHDAASMVVMPFLVGAGAIALLVVAMVYACASKADQEAAESEVVTVGEEVREEDEEMAAITAMEEQRSAREKQRMEMEMVDRRRLEEQQYQREKAAAMQQQEAFPDLPSPADDSLPAETRVDPISGRRLTKDAFEVMYGGLSEWESVEETSQRGTGNDGKKKSSSSSKHGLSVSTGKKPGHKASPSRRLSAADSPYGKMLAQNSDHGGAANTVAQLLYGAYPGLSVRVYQQFVDTMGLEMETDLGLVEETDVSALDRDKFDDATKEKLWKAVVRTFTEYSSTRGRMGGQMGGRFKVRAQEIHGVVDAKLRFGLHDSNPAARAHAHTRNAAALRVRVVRVVSSCVLCVCVCVCVCGMLCCCVQLCQSTWCVCVDGGGLRQMLVGLEADVGRDAC
jgi:hypothetical protein